MLNNLQNYCMYLRLRTDVRICRIFNTYTRYKKLKDQYDKETLKNTRSFFRTIGHRNYMWRGLSDQTKRLAKTRQPKTVPQLAQYLQELDRTYDATYPVQTIVCKAEDLLWLFVRVLFTLKCCCQYRFPLRPRMLHVHLLFVPLPGNTIKPA